MWCFIFSCNFFLLILQRFGQETFITQYIWNSSIYDQMSIGVLYMQDTDQEVYKTQHSWSSVWRAHKQQIVFGGAS